MGQESVEVPVAGSSQLPVGVPPALPTEKATPDAMYTAALMYYEENATQAQVASRLGISRATVSRLLAEARARGVVRIEVVRPMADTGGLAGELTHALGLDRVYIETAERRRPESPLSTAVARALEDAALQPGDVLLVSSGRTVFEAARGALPRLSGVVVAPTIGGQDEAEAWFQTNEITRIVADKVGGRPIFLFGPALPSADLHTTLVDEPSIRRVISLWELATCALVGIGSPLLTRSSIPAHLPSTDPTLIRAIGDISSRFFLRDGTPVEYPGGERLLAIALSALAAVPRSIGVAYGESKVGAVTAASRAGFIRRLVTDEPTALLLHRHLSAA